MLFTNTLTLQAIEEHWSQFAHMTLFRPTAFLIILLKETSRLHYILVSIHPHHCILRAKNTLATYQRAPSHKSWTSMILALSTTFLVITWWLACKRYGESWPISFRLSFQSREDHPLSTEPAACRSNKLGKKLKGLEKLMQTGNGVTASQPRFHILSKFECDGRRPAERNANAPLGWCSLAQMAGLTN